MISVYDAYSMIEKSLNDDEVIAGIGESENYYIFDIREKNGGDMTVYDIPCVSKDGKIFSIDFSDWCEEVDKGKTRVIDLEKMKSDN